MNTITTLQAIPIANKYEGYLWWNNKAAPDVYLDQKVSEKLSAWPLESANPFIVEGNLWDPAKELSFSIRYIDGAYLVHEFRMSQLVGYDFLTKNYLPNRFPKTFDMRLSFCEYWLPERDPFCEGMEVLRPAMMVFTGFTKA